MVAAPTALSPFVGEMTIRAIGRKRCTRTSNRDSMALRCLNLAQIALNVDRTETHSFLRWWRDSRSLLAPDRCADRAALSRGVRPKGSRAGRCLRYVRRNEHGRDHRRFSRVGRSRSRRRGALYVARKADVRTSASIFAMAAVEIEVPSRRNRGLFSKPLRGG